MSVRLRSILESFGIAATHQPNNLTYMYKGGRHSLPPSKFRDNICDPQLANFVAWLQVFFKHGELKSFSSAIKTIFQYRARRAIYKFTCIYILFKGKPRLTCSKMFSLQSSDVFFNNCICIIIFTRTG